MQTEILPVSLAQKAVDIDAIRWNFFPLLEARAYGAERTLKILHQLGTYSAKPLTSTQDRLYSSYTAMYASPTLIKPEDTERILDELQNKGCEHYTPLGYFLKGDYRILGCFSPNTLMARYAPETGEFFTGAIPVQTRDYHHTTESPFYYPPVLNIHKLMAAIGSNFDFRFPVADGKVQVARTVGEFYFWGLVMVHPFLGANHRAFDRFMELSFDKKHLSLDTPLNRTLNIPNDDQFNVALYEARRRFLESNGLLGRTFSLDRWRDMSEWLKYNHDLNESLNTGIQNQGVNTDDITDALLRWA